MLRDVPYCKSILACGVGGLILSVVMFTWVYPTFQNKVSQVKETKVREYMADRYGISDGSVSVLRSADVGDTELPKTTPAPPAATAGASLDVDAPAVGSGSGVSREDDAGDGQDDAPLPPAKRH